MERMPPELPPVSPWRWRRSVRIVGLAALAAAAGACAKAQAKTPVPPPPPPLETPAPEPRLIIPISVEPEELPPPPATTTAPAPRRETASKPPPAPTSPPTPPPSAPPEPQPVLQPTASISQVETDARNLLASANHNLNRVQVWTLDTNGIANWKHARYLVAAAQRALDLKSYDYAKQVAGKAARLAALLVPGEADAAAPQFF
jgi:outer membrane biosynthesis protein TonB